MIQCSKEAAVEMSQLSSAANLFEVSTVVFSVNLIREEQTRKDSCADQLRTTAVPLCSTEKLLCKVSYSESQKHLGIKNKE